MWVAGPEGWSGEEVSKVASAAMLSVGVAVAFVLRLWMLRSIPLIETDGVRYVTIARQLRESGSPFDPLFHPLYPTCIAILEPLVGDYELAGRLVSAVFGSALIVPSYALARTLLGRPAAILLGVLLAIHPAMVRSSMVVLSEATYTFLVVLGAWMGWRGLAAPGRGLLAVAGLCFGFAYLVRPEGALYLSGLLAASLVVGIPSNRSRVIGIEALGALAAFGIVSGPYLVYLRRTLGYWTLSGKVMHNLRLDVGAGMATGQTDFEILWLNPGTVSIRILENAFLFEKYVLPELFPGVLILFLLPGVLTRVREPGWTAREGLLLALALPPFASLAFHVEARIFFPILPFVLALLAAGILWTATWLAGSRPALPWSVSLTVLVVAALAPYTLRPILRPDPGASLYRQAAQWVAATQAPRTVLMDRKPFVAFYSDRRFTLLGHVSPADLAAAARRAGAQLIVLDSRTFDDRPLLVPLLYEPPPPGLEVLREFDAGQAGKLRILGVRDHG